MTTNPPIVKGLDVGPESDPSWFMAQPSPPPDEIDPADTRDPILRALLIERRRAAGLSDYPTDSDRRRSVAD